MPRSRVASIPISTEMRGIGHPIKGTFETTIPHAGVGVASDVGMMIQVRMMSYNTLISGFPNQKFSSALDVNTIERYIMSMAPKNDHMPCELSDMAKKAIALAVEELDAGQCKTFSNIDELFADLESD